MTADLIAKLNDEISVNDARMFIIHTHDPIYVNDILREFASSQNYDFIMWTSKKKDYVEATAVNSGERMSTEQLYKLKELNARIFDFKQETRDEDDALKWFMNTGKRFKKLLYTISCNSISSLCFSIQDNGIIQDDAIDLTKITSSDEKRLLILIVNLNLDEGDTEMLEKFEDAVHIECTSLDDRTVSKICTETLSQLNISFGDNTVNKIKQILSDMKMADARRLLLRTLRTYIKSGDDSNDTSFLRVLAEQSINSLNCEALQLIPKDTSAVIPGGLDNLKSYIEDELKLRFTPDAEAFGLSKPKGILLLGPPGCGKSLSAQYIADQLCVPMLEFKVEGMLSRYVAEGEIKARKAFQTIDSLPPCVIYIDEIEKLFSGTTSTGSAHESSKRLLGMMLSWLSDRKSSAFIVATPNNVLDLPPELFRSGRFDATFYLGYPDHTARCEILLTHLNKKNHQNAFTPEQISSFSTLTEDFSAAEIGGVVEKALLLALKRDKILREEDVKQAILQTCPLSRTRPVEIQALSEIGSRLGISASSETKNEEEEIIPQWDYTYC